MIPLIFPVIGFNDIFTCYLRKDRKIDRAAILAKEFGKKNCYFVSEGREALALALQHLNLNKEDEVIVPSYVCDIVPKVVGRFATVVYADINPSTLVVDAEEIKRKFSNRTKAVIVVHIYGKVNDLINIYRYCRDFNIPLIEDCAQAIYSFEENKRAGYIGDYTILSFRFSKDLNLAKGGALLTNKAISIKQKRRNTLVALVNILLVHMALRLQFLFIGRIYYYAKEYMLIPFFSKTEYTPKKILEEISTFEQELVLEGIRKMPAVLEKKKRVASAYASCLTHIDNIELCSINNNSFMRFNILASNRQGLIKVLHQNGIECDKMYSYCMSQTCKQSLLISQRIVNLPVHPGVSDDHIEKICRIIRNYYAKELTAPVPKCAG